MADAPPAVCRPRRRRWRRWLTACLFLVVSAPWWLPDLPFVRKWVAGRIAARTGMACELDGLDLFNGDFGPSADGVRLTSRGGLRVELDHVEADIQWRSLLSGRVDISTLTVKSGRLRWQPTPSREPAEEESPEPTVPQPPALAQQTEPAAPVGLVPLADASEPAPEVASAPASVAATPVPAEIPPATPEPAPEVASAAAPSPPPTQATPSSPPVATTPAAAPAKGRRWSVGRVKVSDFDLELLTPGSGAEVFSARLRADVPLGATPADGAVAASGLTLLGRPLPAGPEVPLRWNGSVLAVPQTAWSVPGGEVGFWLQAEPFSAGTPCLGEVKTEGIDLALVSLWLGTDDSAAAHGTLRGGGQFAGYLRFPRTLQAVGAVSSADLRLPLAAWLKQAGVASARPEPELVVKKLQAQVAFANLTLAVRDASLFADEMTLRSMGLVTSAGAVSFSGRVYLTQGGRDRLTQLTAGWPPERRIPLAVLPNSPWVYTDSYLQGPLDSPRIALWDQWWTVPELRGEWQRLTAAARPASVE